MLATDKPFNLDKRQVLEALKWSNPMAAQPEWMGKRLSSSNPT